MADSKIIVFAVAALVVGAAIGIGAGALIFKDKSSDDETYYYYLYLGEGNDKNGWYSAKAANANAALDKAFDVEGIEVEWSEAGYPTVSGASGSYEYLWNTTSKFAADNSTSVTGTTLMGNNDYSGWRQYNASGVPDGEHKMGCGNGHIFFLSAWVKVGGVWTLPTPGDVDAWKTAEGTPFATA